MIHPLIQLLRPYYTVPFPLGLLVIASYVAGSVRAFTLDWAWASASLFCLLCGAYAFNDLCDIEIDRIDHPDRPLPSGRLRPRTAVVLALLFLLAALALAALVNPWYLLTTLTLAAGLAAYDLYGKRMGLFKPILAAALTTAIYALAFALAEPMPSPRLAAVRTFPVWLFLTGVGYEMLKDMHGSADGPAWRLRVARAFVVVGSLIALLPWLLGYCGWMYAPFAVAAVLLAVLTATRRPLPAILCIYAAVALVTVGSLADLLVFGR